MANIETTSTPATTKTKHISYGVNHRFMLSSRIASRRPFVIEAARLVNLNQTEQETWEQSWIQGVPPGHDLVTNPTCPQPGFTLPRRQFVTLNHRLRCVQARCAESLHRWGVITSPACPCGESHQTTRHIVEECPLTACPGGLQRLHQAGPDAVECLLRLSMKLRECSRRTTTTVGISFPLLNHAERPTW